MSSDAPPPLSFDALRAKAISAAQAASGKIWTDYNLHDPGVTLLEQTVFALTEVAYQGDHAPRDLLTSAEGTFDTSDLALFDADLVLPGRPVTMSDLASCLSDIDQLERVFASDGPKSGLINLVIIPLDSVNQRENRKRKLQFWRDSVKSEVRARFDEIRLLCADINKIEIATPVPIALHGSFEVDDRTIPERVVAEAIHRISLALKGLSYKVADGTITGATRNDIFTNPAAIWPAMPGSADGGPPIDLALPALQDIPGLARVTHFEMRDPATGAIAGKFKHTGDATYYRPTLPVTGLPFTLTATRDSASVALNNDTIHEELGRLQAQHIAARNNRRDEKDRDVLQPGKPRSMDRLPVDAMLPAPYRIAERKAGNGGLTGYRSMMDGHLNRMIAPLGRLGTTYAQARGIDVTNPADVRERITMLDYLLSLHGEEMPVCDPSWMHIYRGTQAQLAWQIDWRERYLAKLPKFNQFAGSAHKTCGFLARLAHLADLQVGSALPDDLLAVDDTHVTVATQGRPDDVILPVRPLDTFITPDSTAEPLSLAKLAIACPWITDNRITGADFGRAAQAEAYILARNRKGDWDVLFQPTPGGGFHVCGTHQSRSRVEDWANRVRQTFVQFNQAAEQIWLVEDITMRTEGGNFTAFEASVLIPGWTARTQNPSYRRYVEDLIVRLAPAHVFVRPLWLNPAQMKTVHPFLQSGGKDPAMREVLRQVTTADAAP